ncbi:MAG: c-type cytochrome [Bacteroidota bacterium]|nr:c-type cytochrome [Bacteroidota bacterium]
MRQIAIGIFLIFIYSACKQEPVKHASTRPLLFIPDDMEITLWAQSPMLYNPTNMDIDSRGRVWISEAVNYRNYNNDSSKMLHHSQGDRIIILEDTDGDGKADTSKVFVQDKDLVSPLGIAVIGNRVFVSCSPYLIVYTDDNGDDKPDHKEIILQGFGGKDHDHGLHAVVAGPDGNLYFNVGDAGPHIVKDKKGWTLRSGSLYTGGSPYNLKNQGNMKSDDGKVWVGGLALRMSPRGDGLKVMADNFRNSYEMTIDSRGDMWQNDNDDQVATCRTTWMTEGGNAGFFSADGTRTWQADQRPWQDVFTAHWHQDDPGVMPAGDKTGAGAPTGIVLNESDALGEKYRGLLLSADAGRNVIFGYFPKKQGSGYNLEGRNNLITSLPEDNVDYVWNDSSQGKDKDKWFRPSDISIGTDGAIYIADWYDPVVGGHQMKDSTGYGRIYRIASKGKHQSSPQINFSTVSGMIEAFKSPAINVRNTGFEKLKARGEAVIPALTPMLRDKNPFVQARVIWLLAQLGPRGQSIVEGLLRDRDENIRITAFRALRPVVRDITPYVAEIENDPSPFVRREAIQSLKDVPYYKKKPYLLKLIEQYDGKDRWYLEAIGSALEGNENEIYPEIRKIFNPENYSPVKWNEKLSSITWRLHPSKAVSDLAVRAGSNEVLQTDRSRALCALGFIKTRAAALAMIDLSKSKLKDVAGQASYWVAFRQSNDWFNLLDWDKTGIDLAHERLVAEMKVSMVKILDEHMPFDEKKGNAEKMAKDSVGGQMLLGLVAENKINKALLPVVESLIFSNPNQSVRTQASLYFKKPGTERRISIPAIIQMNSNASTGKEVFTTHCTTCHRVAENGKDIGPDLSLIGKKFDREGLLDAIVNPSAGIVFGYEPWTINTSDGQSYFGFLIADGAQAVVIKDLTGKKNTIATAHIISRKKYDRSVMPEPQVLGLSDQNLADLAEYLLKFK